MEKNNYSPSFFLQMFLQWVQGKNLVEPQAAKHLEAPAWVLPNVSINFLQKKYEYIALHEKSLQVWDDTTIKGVI